MNLTNLHTTLTDFVQEEARVQRDEHLKHIRRPIEDRVEEERCLADLTFKHLSGDDNKNCLFECPGTLGNTAQFREGDRLRLHNGEYEMGMDVMLVRESGKGIELRSEDRFSALAASVKANAYGWILDESFFDSEKMLLTGLENAMATADGRDRVLSLFAGTAQDEMDFGLDDLDDADNYADEAGLNDSQAEALTMAASAKHSHLVQGPPGTGKTYVLARTIATLVERGERVLLSAFTHRAIHHALRSCLNAIRDEECIAKIGTYIHDTTLAPISQYVSWGRCPLRHKSGGILVGATPFASASKRLADVTFDTVVVDESSQMTIPLAILAMLKGRKFIFFGDHKQLPPVLQSIPKRDAASWSVFGSLARHSDVTTLTTTYRLNKDLAHWPSENFYSGDLLSHESVAARKTVYPNGQPDHAALKTTASIVYIEIPHEGNRTVSPEEAEAVTAITDAALLAGISPEEIGVVTPFRRQAQRIRQAIRKSIRVKDLNPAAIVVDTVERFQGQERELVILSLTTSDPEFLNRIADFYYQEERWNVAATRARSKLVIIGSPTMAQFDPLDTDLAESVSLIRRLLNNAEKIAL
jgi:DNA replication ATP-dependent helicase Dna2